MATVISKTPPPTASTAPGANLQDKLFNDLVWQQGRRVLHEIALQCPCKSEESNQRSTCKNCGGTGWTFINKKETKMVVTKVNTITEFKDWSEKVRGMINITALHDEELSYMDRLTLLDGNAIHNEVLHFKKNDDNTVTFAYTTYNIKKVLYFGRFVDDNTPYQRLELGVHYSIEDNIVRIIDSGIAAIESLAVTIRYNHAPQFHVMELPRETMQSWRKHPGKELEHLPVSAVAQRTHYILDAKNLTNDRTVDNSYDIPCQQKQQLIVNDIEKSIGSGGTIIIINTTKTITLPLIEYNFVNQISFSINHNFGRKADISIFDDNNKKIVGQIVDTGLTATITFNRSKTGKIILQ